MRFAERMTEKQLKVLTKTRACGSIPGLVVKVVKLKDGSLAKYFILRESTINRIFTLGRYPQMSLADAFKKAAEWKVKIQQGVDPSEEEKALKASLRKKSTPGDDRLTFEQLIYMWIEFNEARGRWNNPSKPKKEVWEGHFRNHIPDSIRLSPVEELKAEHFAAALGEKWRTMIDTPERILSDARQAIDWAIRSELILPMLNPAQVKDGKLGDLLPLVRAEGGHEPALPPKRMPFFFAELMKLVPVSQTARCLAFAILTAARNSTAREATWEEIKEADGQWFHVIPRARMKVKGEKIPFDRKTPLSPQALELLNTAPRIGLDPKAFIFPNINKGRNSPFTRDSVRALIKRMHDKQKAIDGIGWIDPEQTHAKTGKPRIVTLHGCARATFNTWAKDSAGYKHKAFSRDLRESCLDHRNESYQCAYDREQALGDMREVFDAWGRFCFSQYCP